MPLDSHAEFSWRQDAPTLRRSRTWPGQAQAARRPVLRLHTLLKTCVALTDAGAFALLLAQLAVATTSSMPDAPAHLGTILALLGFIAGAALMPFSSLYAPHRVMAWRGSCALACVPLAVGVIATASASVASGADRHSVATAALIAFAVGLAFLVLSRLAWRSLFRVGIDAGFLCYRVIVMGSNADSVASMLRHGASPFFSVHSFSSLGGSIRAAMAYARRHGCDTILLAYPSGELSELPDSFNALRAAVPDILIYSPVGHGCGLPASHPLAGHPVMPLQRSALGEGAIFIKGALDRLGALLLVILLAPLLCATAIAIAAESRGPVFFIQPRVGYNNRIFFMLKFRSMYHDARDAKARVQTQRNDRRITRVGRFIRRWSIDELPQLFNVLRGDMSLVGPRPHAPGTNVDGMLLNHAHDEYTLRHRVQPGITGWAQVNGSRGALTRPEEIARRVSLDLFYIENWSLWLDLKILVLTLIRALKAE